MSLCFAGLIVFPRGPLGGQVGTSGVTGYFQRSTVSRPLRPLLDRYDRYTTHEHIMFLCTWCLPSFPPGPDASRGSRNQNAAGWVLGDLKMPGVRRTGPRAAQHPPQERAAGENFTIWEVESAILL